MEAPEIKQLAQGHPARKWQGWDSNPGPFEPLGPDTKHHAVCPPWSVAADQGDAQGRLEVSFAGEGNKAQGGCVF